MTREDEAEDERAAEEQDAADLGRLGIRGQGVGDKANDGDEHGDDGGHAA